jgi:hypothetical protein
MAGYPAMGMSRDGLDANMLQGLTSLLGVEQAQAEKESLPPNYIAAGQGGKAGGFVPGQTKMAVKKPADLQKKKDDVWEDQDLRAGSGVTVKDKGDDRAEPKYDILLRQDLGSQDLYLNLGDRDPGSDHCNTIVVKVFMPDTELKNISLEVLQDRVLVQAPKYRLNLALPHPVRKDDGKAEWEKLKACLKVTLPIEQKITYVQNIGDALPESTKAQLRG